MYIFFRKEVIEMSEKKNFRFNIIDAIVVLVIVAVVIFVVSNVFGGELQGAISNNAQDSKSQTYVMSYFFEEVPDFAAEMIDKGSVVTDEAYGHELGKLISVDIGDSVSYATNDQGQIVKSSKDGYKSVAMSVEVNAKSFDHGIEIEKIKYVVGHTMTVYAGKAKLYGRISGIEKK